MTAGNITISLHMHDTSCVCKDKVMLPALSYWYYTTDLSPDYVQCTVQYCTVYSTLLYSVQQLSFCLSTICKLKTFVLLVYVFTITICLKTTRTNSDPSAHHMPVVRAVRWKMTNNILVNEKTQSNYFNVSFI